MSDIYNPASPGYQDLAELARKRREEAPQRIRDLEARARILREERDRIAAPVMEWSKARADYYQALRDKYNDYPSLSDRDYDFLEAVQTVINSPGFDGDAELERDRGIAAAIYANNFNQPIDVVYQNLDVFHEQWTGRNFAKKTGIQAVVDSLGLSFLGPEHNKLAIEYHNSGRDPEILKELQALDRKMERLRDNVPKVWQEEYIRQGGVADILALFRSITTSAAENAVPIGTGILAGALAATGAGAVASAAGLSSTLSGLLVAGASGLAVAETTAASTVGTEYYDLISQGIPDDIAWTNANISAQVQGAIEALGGGVTGTVTKGIIRAAAPGAVNKAAARWFIKGKMGLGAKAFLGYLRETAGEGLEEGAQQFTGITFYNRAAEETNRRREETLQKIYAEPLEDARKELEKELEQYPEVNKKEFETAWKEIVEASIGGIGTALLLGIPGARIGYKNDMRAASVIAAMAKEAPNEAALLESVKKAKEAGFEPPFTEGMTAEEETAFYSDIHKTQQERLTPEQREARQKAIQDAEALSEITDYRNARAVEVTDGETNEVTVELAAPDTSDVYRENGRLEISEYTDLNEDGNIDGRFVAGDPRVEDAEGSGTNQYGYVNYTETEDAVTVNDFKMLAGYENLRADLFNQFAERFAGKNIVWNPRNEQNLNIREQLANANPRGPKEGLNYYERGDRFQVSVEARRTAERFRPYLKNSTPLETALAVETFGAFYRRRGESLNGAMNRLLGRITNEAPEAVTAAQREGRIVKGATWLEQTAEGMRRVVYLSKHAADSSTVVHEISHAVAADFTDGERAIAARALDGYQLKDGTVVSFEGSGNEWTDEQHEAFAEALENYLANGSAPNEEIKGLFDRIKDFMKRVYRTMKGWTELSPQVEEFYKSLLSGELAGQARTETASRTLEEGPGGAQTAETRQHDAAEGGETPQEAARTQQRDAVIESPDVPPESKAQAALDAAGAVLMQTVYHGTPHTVDRFDVDRIGSEPRILLQTGDRDMMEEAATFEDGKDYRSYIETFYQLPDELEGFTDEQIDAWFDEYVKKAKQADNSTGRTDGENATGKLSPADLDREFSEMIGDPGTLEEFVETAEGIYNENYDNWQAVDEEDEAARDRRKEITDTLRRKLTHPTWESIFRAGGKIGTTQRKQLLTLIRRAPRDYRAIYAEVMSRDDLAVTAEDTTAAALKYRIADSRARDIDSLTPEKLRQLAEQLDVEDFAEKVRTGRAQFNDPTERAYIKQLQDQRDEIEGALREAEADRREDNEYLERMAGKQFAETFDRALKAREELTRRNDKLDRAVKNGQADADRMARQTRRAAANYHSVVDRLESLAKAQRLEIDVRQALEGQRVHDAVKAAREISNTEWRSKLDALREEYKDFRKSAKTQATLTARFARKAAREELRAHLAELKDQQETGKALTRAKRGVAKRILRPVNPREVDAGQGQAIVIIQRLVEPSMLEGIDRFIGGIEKPYLRTIFETWKTDELLRAGILKDKSKNTREKMNRLFSKEKFDQLTTDEKKYLYRKIPPKDWAAALGLEDIIKRRNENYPAINGEAAMEIAFKYLPADVYYRIMDTPFSEWTLEQGEELAKIIDSLIIQGKEIYKANLDAEKRRIREYQNAVAGTVRTVAAGKLQINPGDTPEEKARKTAEIEKILGKYNEGVAGTAQASSRRRNFRGPLFGYADMNMYRFARMLDNGDTNGKNSAALYRRARDAYNQKMAAVDTRTGRIQKLMKDLGITEEGLWGKSVEIDLGGDLGKTAFTAAELIGFLSAVRDDYSRDAVLYGNLLSEKERGPYQQDGLSGAGLVPLEMLAEGRFNQVRAEAQKLIAENPNYQKLMEAIDADFTEGGRRLSDALVRYNNTWMSIVKNYFPIIRQAPVSVQTADAKYARDLMGASYGAFNLFVEKGFTKERQAIPPQYQTAIKLDVLGVWSEAVSREEHFMAYGQLVKDLNAVYKQNRQVKDAIQRRYGRQAVDYINKYINELASPTTEKVRTALDNTIRNLRGNTAAAYLGWKTSTIAKQFLTSPAPFFAYMNPIEYWGAFVEFSTNREGSWREITSLSEYIEHRSANLLTDIVKERAKQKFDSKAEAAISAFNKKGMEGLEWIDRMCVAPGWLVLYRKEYARLTDNSDTATMSEKDIRVKAARYADDITGLIQPSALEQDLSPLFKGNTELGKAFLQFTASLNVIWQNIRYDLPQMIRDKRYKSAAGTVIGYTLAGIMLGAVTAGFDEDDDEASKIQKAAWWATTQFTDAFPIIGSEVTRLTELAFTGKMRYQGGMNILPTFQKGYNAATGAVSGIQNKDFDKLLKAAAAAVEAAAIYKALPVSGFKEAGRVIGIGGGKTGFNPGAALGRR
ncbi:MAG: hypothetical protein LBP76_10285 [Treponema sp.]|jgi:hypothetical protein|nr:hypothetical protein [Treponema sp.]